MTTTKKCPNCGNTALGLMRTLNLKFCPDCDTWMEWRLDPGQPPLLGPSRKVGSATPVTPTTAST